MSIDNVKLKPCPFCGESALLAVRPIHNYSNEEVGADITCERCLATFRSEEATNADEVVEHWNKRAFYIGRWKEVEGNYVTPGGTPLYVCAQCGGGQHLYGVEYPQQALICPKCGSINLYPWEKMRWLEDDNKARNEHGNASDA